MTRRVQVILASHNKDSARFGLGIFHSGIEGGRQSAPDCVLEYSIIVV
jgi:hypothetical protein